MQLRLSIFSLKLRSDFLIGNEHFCEKYLCFALGASLVDKSFIFIFYNFTAIIRIFYD
jgi:hypothetical protein